MKLNDVIIHIKEEFVPWNDDSSAKLARQFLRAAQGDPAKAKKVAEYFYQQVLGEIDKHYQQRLRPIRVPRARVD